MHMLAYGCGEHSLDKMLMIVESTALGYLYRFSSAFVQAFEKEFVRAPNNEETRKLLQRPEHFCLSRMLGSIDCRKCRWNNWSTDYHGK